MKDIYSYDPNKINNDIYSDNIFDKDATNNNPREIFFKDPEEELQYFEDRMDKISNYSNNFFKSKAYENLAHRYLLKLAFLQEDYESDVFRQLYTDFLIRLGIDDYILEKEIENYRKIFITKQPEEDNKKNNTQKK